MTYIRNILTAVALVALSAVTSVQAALPAEFSTEIGLIKTDVVDVMTQSLSVIGLCIVAGLPIFGLLFFLRKGKRGFRAAS